MSNDPISSLFGVLAVLYILLCAVIVPVAYFTVRAEERACAAEYQVFACERGPWVPVIQKEE